MSNQYVVPFVRPATPQHEIVVFTTLAPIGVNSVIVLPLNVSPAFGAVPVPYTPANSFGLAAVPIGCTWNIISIIPELAGVYENFPPAIMADVVLVVLTVPLAEATDETTCGVINAIAADVNAVVAIWVVFVPGAAVGAVGVPVSAGDASGA